MAYPVEGPFVSAARYSSPILEFFSFNTSAEAPCDELFVKNNSHYEKIDHSYFCAFDPCYDAGLLRERTRDNYDHDNA
jgi:hypothetical protein